MRVCADAGRAARCLASVREPTKEESWLSALRSTASAGRVAPPSARRTSAGSTSSGSRSTTSTGVETLAHLLRHDTVYGPFPATIEVAGDAIVVDGVEIPVFAEPDPAELPWGELGVEVVIESTGLFRKRADAMKHLEAGARKVIVSAPAKEPDVDGRARRQLRDGVRPGRAPRDLERVVHDELPRAGREGAARDGRHPARR